MPAAARCIRPAPRIASSPRSSSSEAGIATDMVRLSCGIEDTADIIADLDQALAAVQ